MSDSKLPRLVMKNYRKVIPVVLLAGILYIAHYWNIAEFGLYEDDLTIIPDAIQMSFDGLSRYIFDYITTLSGQGRPLHHSFIHLFSNVGFRINGLSGIYLIGYFVELLNAILLYTLIRRIHTSRWLAILAGVLFVLYPADTTKIYLTHSLGLHPSIFFVLLGFHLYLSNHLVLAYILASLALICYESLFPVFIAAPLLGHNWNRKLLRRVLIHAFILSSLLIVVYMLRISIDELRVSTLPVIEMLTASVVQMQQGPPVALGTYLFRPVQVVISLGAVTSIGLAMIATVLTWIFIKESDSKSNRKRNAELAARESFLILINNWVERNRKELELLATGVIMMTIAYAITFTTRAYAITGRDTRVHAAAVIGASIVAAVVAHLFITTHRLLFRRAALLLLMLILSFLTAFGVLVQQDYLRAWELQQEFWSNLLPLIQDVEPGSVVFIDPQGMEDTHQIWANHWNLPRVLVQLYSFPDTWRPLPRVYRMVTDWEQELVGVDGLFRIDESTVVAPTSTYQEVESINVVLIRVADGLLERQQEPLVIDGQAYPLKPISQPTLIDLEEGLLYKLLIDG